MLLRGFCPDEAYKKDNRRSRPAHHACVLNLFSSLQLSNLSHCHRLTCAASLAKCGCAAVVHACWNNADRVLFIVFIRLCAHWAGASGGAGARQQQQQPALASERRRGSNGLPRPQPALRLLYRVPASTVLRGLKARVVLGLLSFIGRCMWPAGYLRLFEHGIAGCRAGRLYLLRVLPASAYVAQDVGQTKLAERFQLFGLHICFFTWRNGRQYSVWMQRTSRCCHVHNSIHACPVTQKMQHHSAQLRNRYTTECMHVKPSLQMYVNTRFSCGTGKFTGACEVDQQKATCTRKRQRGQAMQHSDFIPRQRSSCQ